MAHALSLTPEAARSLYKLVESLVERRKELQLSQRDLAKRMEVAQSTVAKLERHLQEPTLPLLDRCAQALGLRMKCSLEPLTAETLTGALAEDAGDVVKRPPEPKSPGTKHRQDAA